MKLARVGAPGAEIPVVIEGDTLRDARHVTADFTPEFFASGKLAALREALPTLPTLEDEGLRRGSPIATAGAIICVGMNYVAHAAETGAAPPEFPVIFLKTPNTIAGPYDAVTIPPGSTHTDWEVELGIVIGSRAAYLNSPADALAHVAGFVLANDVSERRYQIDESGGQWSKGKCAPGFSPLGPWLVTPDEVDHQALRLRSWVNGEPRQDSSTADQIFNVATVIHHLSHYLTLEPGDVVLTGTPEGVALSGRFPYLSDGDVVEVEIEGLGRARQVFRAYEGTQA